MMICCSVVFSYVLDFSSRIVFGRKLPWYVDDLAYIVAGCCLLAARVMAMSSGLSFISLSYKLATAWWLFSLDRIRKRLSLLPLRRSFQCDYFLPVCRQLRIYFLCLSDYRWSGCYVLHHFNAIYLVFKCRVPRLRMQTRHVDDKD